MLERALADQGELPPPRAGPPRRLQVLGPRAVQPRAARSRVNQGRMAHTRGAACTAPFNADRKFRPPTSLALQRTDDVGGRATVTRGSRAVAALAVAGGLLVAGSAQAAPTWAPASSATSIRASRPSPTAVSAPPTSSSTTPRTCTSARPPTAPAPDGNTATDGCDSGLAARSARRSRSTAPASPARMVYNSWITMQAHGEADADTCAYNDLALVRLDPADVRQGQPVDPVLGRPDRARRTDGAARRQVYTYGNSSLRGGVTQLSPKQGTSLGDRRRRLEPQRATRSRRASPVTPGSAFMDRQGRRSACSATLQLAPLAGSNGVGDLARELAYMHANGGPQAQLVNGTAPFRGTAAPASVGARRSRSRATQSARRPANARPSVTSSAYSRSPPTGRPEASRVTATSGARVRSPSAMCSAVASPVVVGLVASTTSRTGGSARSTRA